MARSFLRLGALLASTVFLGGCLMLPLHGAMMGADGHGSGDNSPDRGTGSPPEGTSGHGAARDSPACRPAQPGAAPLPAPRSVTGAPRSRGDRGAVRT